MSTLLRVLLVEDSSDDAALIVRELRRGGWDVDAKRVQEERSLREALVEREWDVVLCDSALPRLGPHSALGVLQSLGQELPLVVVSGSIDPDKVDPAAAGFVSKEELWRLTSIVANAVHQPAKEVPPRRSLRPPPAPADESLTHWTLPEPIDAAREDRLREAQKMEAVGRLASGVAHDFNNALSVILTYASFLLQDQHAGAAMRDDLEEIVKAGRRAAALTRQLLAFGRRQAPEPRIVDLNMLLDGLAKMLRRVVGEDIAVTIVHGPSLARVRADPACMELVIVNLVANARDAMPKGGRLTIETANVPAGVNGDSRQVVLLVNDTGLGMDQDTQARIFEPFFTTKGPDQGTGLGLPSVLGIVKQTGGTIEVESAPGMGTTFRIFLPATDEDSVELEPAPSPSWPPLGLAGSETVLVVEDDAQVRAAACATLQRCGYNVLEAQNAGEALLICRQPHNRIDLMLADVVLPRVSAMELAEELRALSPRTKVLYMSGSTGDTVGNYGVLSAGAPFLEKPLTPESLARRVRETLDQSPKSRKTRASRSQ